MRVDGAVVASPRHKLAGGEALDGRRRAPPRHDDDVPREAIALRVVYEDDALLVVDKPAGLVVHPGSGNRDGTLQNALLHHAPALAALPRAGIVHRLDKDTSGLLVVAKTPEAQTDLVRQLAARTVKREYLAVVHGDLARATTVDAPIGRHPTQRTSMAVVERGKPARTHVEVVERFGDRDARALPARDRAHAPDPRASRGARPSAGRRSDLSRPAHGRRDALPKCARSAAGAARAAARPRASRDGQGDAVGVAAARGFRG